MKEGGLAGSVGLFIAGFDSPHGYSNAKAFGLREGGALAPGRLRPVVGGASSAAASK